MVRIKKYLLIGLKNDTIVFKYLDKTTNESVVNSNSLIEGYFLYTLKYIKKNKKGTCLIINEEIKIKNITRALLEEENITLSFDLLSYLNISEIDISHHVLSLEECDILFRNRFVKKINCYFLPQILIKRFLSKKIKIELNYIDSINDIFMISNDIIDYDILYYKKSINIGYNNFSVKDFKEFVKINKYLRYIHLYYYNKEVINSIIESLIDNNKSKIAIILHQNDKNNWIEKNFTFLKKTNKDYSSNLDGEIRIIYSKKYIKNNLFKQLSYNNIKMAIVIILYVLLMGLIFSELYKYISKYSEYQLSYELMSSLPIESTTSTETSLIPQVEVSKIKEEDNKKSLEKVFNELNKINKDTIGWITVNNTKINYPVVQHSNNEYYLNHSFYKKYTTNGWIFMDYRNEKNKNNDNIIIYGHNLKSGAQFGTLSKVLEKSWIKDPDNTIIRFDTEDYEMEWEIFSVYTINYTTDYLDVSLDSKTQYEDFINLITKRSKYNFGNAPKYKTKILTLSTCSGYSTQNKRLVVHAKLISKEEA